MSKQRPEGPGNAHGQSAAMRLVSHVWRTMGCKSWERINQAMREALSLAISAEMEFGLSDFSQYDERFRFDYWGGTPTEGWYTDAVLRGNLSAARSYEQWKGREPFVFDRITDCRYHHGRGNPHAKGRLAVNFQFTWQDETFTVTSFAKDGSYLVACTYKPREDGYAPDKIASRVKMTVADLRADMKARREARKAGKGEDDAN